MQVNSNTSRSNTFFKKVITSYEAAFCHRISKKIELEWKTLYSIGLFFLIFCTFLLIAVHSNKDYPPPLSELKRVDGAFRYAEIYDLKKQTTIETSDGDHQAIHCVRRPPCDSGSEGKPAVAWFSKNGDYMYQLHINSIEVLSYWKQHESASHNYMAIGRSTVLYLRIGIALSIILLLLLLARWHYFYKHVNTTAAAKNGSQASVTRNQLIFKLGITPFTLIASLILIYTFNNDISLNYFAKNKLKDHKIQTPGGVRYMQLNPEWKDAKKPHNGAIKSVGVFYRLANASDILANSCEITKSQSAIDCVVKKKCKHEADCSSREDRFRLIRNAEKSSENLIKYEFEGFRGEVPNALYTLAYIQKTQTNGDLIIFCSPPTDLRSFVCRGDVSTTSGTYVFDFSKHLLPSYEGVRQLFLENIAKQ